MQAGKNAEKMLSEPGLKPGQKTAYARAVAEGNAAREKMTEHSLEFAVSSARRLFTKYKKLCKMSGISLDDCIQQGALGVMKAVTGYRPDKGMAFSSYASLRADGLIIDFFRERAAHIRLSRSMLNKVKNDKAFADAQARLLEKIEKAPSKKERQKPLKELSLILRSRSGIRPLSGNQPLSYADSAKAFTRFEKTPSPKAGPVRRAELAELRQTFLDAFDRLPRMTGEVFKIRYLFPESPLSLKEVARRIIKSRGGGTITESRVSQMHSDGLRRMLKSKKLRLRLGVKPTFREFSSEEIKEVSRRLSAAFGTNSKSTARKSKK